MVCVSASKVSHCQIVVLLASMRMSVATRTLVAPTNIASTSREDIDVPQIASRPYIKSLEPTNVWMSMNV